MGRRLTRKQLKKDEFVTLFDHLAQWFTDNWRPMLAGIGAVCVIGLMWWGAEAYTGSRTNHAADQLRAAVQTYMGSATDPTKPAGDVAAAEKQLRAVIDRYSRSRQADEARLYLARILADRGDTDGARDLLVKVASRHQGEALARLATLDLVHMRVAAGQGADVATELTAMVTGKDERLPRDVALFELGSLYVKEREYDKARDYLKQLVDQFPDSPYTKRAQQQLQELG